MTPGRVLVVDDEPDIRAVVAEFLEDEGYAVDTAADGLEALAQVERARPDAIVLDYSMPRCDGEEFSRLLRARPGAPPPVILLTAAAALAERCRRVEADGCLAKPFDLDQLLAAVTSRTHRHPE